MKLRLPLLALSTFLITACSSSAQSCLTSDAIKALDRSWETAQLELDYEAIDALLAPEYTWVHNHAGTIDDRAAVLERITRYRKKNNRSTKSRESKDVEVIIYGSTAIVTGLAILVKDTTTYTYHFMRTYAEVDGQCYQVGNHTMEISRK